MARWKLIFEYDGTDFSGWQKQPEERTVEGEVERAFSDLFQQPIDLVGQGRTDSGVHAKGQTAHADLPERYSAKRIIHAMRGMLPGDIVLLEACTVDESFHARFSATGRTYGYQLMGRLSALNRQRAWSFNYDLDAGLLKEMAECIEGTHDFVNFCIPGPDTNMTTLSTISESYWNTEDEIWRYVITGNRFLRHMVRRLVGTMAHVAAGKLDIHHFRRLLKGDQTGRKGHAAPPHGLYLETVHYVNTNFGCSLYEE